MKPETLLALLKNARFHGSNEMDIQDGIASLLTENGVFFEREVDLGPSMRIDFMCGRIGLEVKVAGSRMNVMRQLKRYCDCDAVDAVILVTICAKHKMPTTLSEKRVCVVHLLTI